MEDYSEQSLLEANTTIEAAITDRGITVSAASVGLDSRVGHVNFLDGDIVIHSSDTVPIEFYGQFQMIPDEYITMIGEWVIYSKEAEQVKRCYETYMADGQ